MVKELSELKVLGMLSNLACRAMTALVLAIGFLVFGSIFSSLPLTTLMLCFLGVFKKSSLSKIIDSRSLDLKGRNV